MLIIWCFSHFVYSPFAPFYVVHPDNWKSIIYLLLVSSRLPLHQLSTTAPVVYHCTSCLTLQRTIFKLPAPSSNTTTTLKQWQFVCQFRQNYATADNNCISFITWSISIINVVNLYIYVCIVLSITLTQTHVLNGLASGKYHLKSFLI